MSDDIETRDETPGQARPRQVSSEIIAARRLRVGLALIHSRIAKWQPRSVWIIASLSGKNPNRPALRREAEELIDQARDGQKALRELAEMIPGVAASSKVFDTRSALERVETQMLEVLEDLRAN